MPWLPWFSRTPRLHVTDRYFCLSDWAGTACSCQVHQTKHSTFFSVKGDGNSRGTQKIHPSIRGEQELMNTAERKRFARVYRLKQVPVRGARQAFNPTGSLNTTEKEERRSPTCSHPLPHDLAPQSHEDHLFYHVWFVLYLYLSTTGACGASGSVTAVASDDVNT